MSDDDEKITNNPVFGVVGLTRTSSSGAFLFGSSAEHQGFISLTVYEAEAIENAVTGELRTFPKKQIVDVWMTEAQFAEFISTWNRHGGVPCTLARRPTEDFKLYGPPLPKPTATARETFSGMVDTAVNNVQKDIDKFVDEIEQIVLPKAGKKDAERLRVIFNCLRKNPSSNLSFAKDMIHENTEKIVARAKVELEAAGRSLLERMGLTKIAEEAKKLLPKPAFDDVEDAEFKALPPKDNEKKG